MYRDTEEVMTGLSRQDTLLATKLRWYLGVTLLKRKLYNFCTGISKKSFHCKDYYQGALLRSELSRPQYKPTSSHHGSIEWCRKSQEKKSGHADDWTRGPP